MSSKRIIATKGKALTGTEVSYRQYQIIKKVAEGFTNSEIALQLEIKMETVKWHVYMLFSALKVKDRKELDPKKIRKMTVGIKEHYIYER